MNCPECRQTIREGARFCSGCGFSTALLKTETDETTRRATNEDAPSTGSLVGRVLDSKYKLVALLGEGGMGAVYRARRLHIGDEVAVKVLHQKFVLEEQAVERFRREARSAAMISHANVVTIHDFSEARGAGSPAYIVMELVRGSSLRELLQREGRLTPERAVALMRDICAGVGVAHRQGLVHRDLKPDNVIVEPPIIEGEREAAKVVDFGIAKLRDVAAEQRLTQTGAVVGTPFYMPPEQCRDESLDARADVYSLGAMFYEMLTGAPPFRASSIGALIAKHMNDAPPPFPPDLRIPPALEAACRRALAKNPAERHADALALGVELQKSLAAHVAASPTPHDALPPPLQAASMHSTVTVEPSTLPTLELAPHESGSSPQQPNPSRHESSSLPQQQGFSQSAASPSRMKWAAGGLLVLLMGGVLLGSVAFILMRDADSPRDTSVADQNNAGVVNSNSDDGVVNSNSANTSVTESPNMDDAASVLNDALSGEGQAAHDDALARADSVEGGAAENDGAQTVNAGDLKGRWAGTYGPLSQPATLHVKEHRGGKFGGVLEQGATRVEFTGTVDAGTRKVRIKETRVLSGEGWSLGEGAGTLAADGRRISGTGKDAFGAQLGLSYEWSFAR